MTRLTNDITQVQNLIMMALRMMLRAPGMLIGAIIMAFSMNAGLARIFLVIMPVMIVVITIIMRTAFPRFTMMQKKLDKVNSNIQETLQNVRVIKSFVRGEYEEERFSRSNEDLKDSSLRAFKVVIFQMPLMAFIMNATTLLVVWMGGKQVLVGDMPVGNLTAFTTYIVQVLMSLMMLAMVLLQSSRAIASAKRINEVLDTEIDLTDDRAGKKDALVQKGRIEFRGVSFRYYKESQEKVLDDINLTIEPGQTVGIIGSTGCGKTTLVSMIPRLYDADEGSVLVDGVDVRDYSLKNLRNGVGMVLQKNVLFSGTIEENLMWGDEDASEEEVIKASEAAQAAAFLQTFPDGWQTQLGQGGVLSLIHIFQEKTLHNGVKPCGGAGKDTGAAGGSHGQKIGVAHSLGCHLFPKLLPNRRGIAAFFKIGAGLPVAAFKIFITAFFCGDIGTGGNSGAVNPFKHIVHKGKMLFTFPGDLVFGEHMMITAYSQADAAVAAVGQSGIGKGVERCV